MSLCSIFPFPVSLPFLSTPLSFDLLFFSSLFPFSTIFFHPPTFPPLFPVYRFPLPSSSLSYPLFTPLPPSLPLFSLPPLFLLFPFYVTFHLSFHLSFHLFSTSLSTFFYLSLHLFSTSLST